MTHQAIVKICGIKQEETLHDMYGLPVDYIGLVFAPSKRQVTLEQAAMLRSASSKIPMAGGRPPRSVGVFVNPSIEQIAEVLSVVPLDVIQLHGEETPDFCREVQNRFGAEVWKAMPVGEDDSADRLSAYKNAVTTILLDTAGGGTGRTFRWDLIPTYQEAAEINGLRLFIAGGLSPENAGQLMKEYRPAGVDISSGVETDGVKDAGKIAAFAERVKRS
ncbi:N-(5'-phosphoribosyl)anthranilate isomerase [Cohnella kolymensis]|uniref:N-(5'-phosphoribosyl)anthranilate isomerase n=1 Tax=Cohnella kolymensis TaxID=1590652 RepID=A0ABR5A2R0_9BACL|nr:phosphoribosylanthranilate isomerase [Cohnella kolymensis]KIL34825.1 N-(5'-phosphoribosyl)anthranilate isomerase [Cohnella kolymensis]